MARVNRREQPPSSSSASAAGAPARAAAAGSGAAQQTRSCGKKALGLFFDQELTGHGNLEFLDTARHAFSVICKGFVTEQYKAWRLARCIEREELFLQDRKIEMQQDEEDRLMNENQERYMLWEPQERRPEEQGHY